MSSAMPEHPRETSMGDAPARDHGSIPDPNNRAVADSLLKSLADEWVAAGMMAGAMVDDREVDGI
jgi:hypothetical protein